MAVNQIPSEITSESEVSMILNSLMYVNDFQEEGNEKTVAALLDSMGTRYHTYNEEQRAYYDCVTQYMKKHPEIGSLIYLNHSSNTRGANDGAIGAAFYSVDSSGNIEDVYVSYRGTGDGRWYDNGDAFSKEYSPYQQDAAAYFDSVMDTLGVTDETNVYVTGHSKGGNQAQFVTLASQNAYLVDKCISMDGEGFSPEAISYFKELYGEDFYNEQLEKMYGICGDNDYVNVLGIKVIPEDHTVYIKTPTDPHDMANSHALVNKETGMGNLFDYGSGEFYAPTSSQREMALFAKSMSDEIMKLPRDQREAICRSLMSVLEYAFTKGVGLNGEVMTKEELLIFLAYLDDVGDHLLTSEEGKALIDRITSELINEEMRSDINGIFDACVLVVGGPVSYWLLQGKGVDIMIYAFERLVDGLTDLVALGANFVMAYEFFCDLKDSVVKFFKEIFDADYRAAQEYLENETLIQLQTEDLHELAEKLWAINGRLETLDTRLDNLYSKVRWRDLWSLMNADFKVCWSSRINKCANCLNDTANRFESVEQQLLQMLG